jgi:hypothetical protein
MLASSARFAVVSGFSANESTFIAIAIQLVSSCFLHLSRRFEISAERLS